MSKLLVNVNSLVPINSLKYQCLSQLANMMEQSTVTTESPPESVQLPSSSSYSLTSGCDSKSNQNYFNLPVELVQLIVDHLTQERVKVRYQTLSALLSTGGCYSLNLSTLAYNSSFDSQDVKKILDILAKNCDHLCVLNLFGYPIPFSDISPIKLQYLNCSITCLQNLLAVFRNFKNLTFLEVFAAFKSLPTTEQMNIFFQELSKPYYKKVCHSLEELGLFSFDRANDGWDDSNEAFLIKLISYFPNLTKLYCKLTDYMAKIITSAQDTGYTGQDGIYITPIEVQRVARILEKLKALEVQDDVPANFSTLTPNLHGLWTNGQESTTNHIENLKYLKSLTMYTQFQNLDLILIEIGGNLQYLSLIGINDIDVASIAQYCPNLKHLSMATSGIISCNLNFQVGLRMSKQEQEKLKRPFLHLKTLLLCHFDQSVLHYILRHAINIEQIKLSRCPDSEQLDIEEELAKLLKINPLTNLRVLIIDGFKSSPKFEDRFKKLIHSFDKLCFAQYVEGQ